MMYDEDPDVGYQMSDFRLKGTEIGSQRIEIGGIKGERL